jgi:hypothetical protein
LGFTRLIQRKFRAKNYFFLNFLMHSKHTAKCFFRYIHKNSLRQK